MKQWRVGVLFIRTGKGLFWNVDSTLGLVCVVRWRHYRLFHSLSRLIFQLLIFSHVGPTFCFLHFNTTTFPFLAINSYPAFSLVNPNLKSHQCSYLNYTRGSKLNFSSFLPYFMFRNLMNYLFTSLFNAEV